MPLLKTTAQVSIAAGASLSAAIDLGAKVLSGILVPAAWTAAGLSFQASDDGGVTWWNLYDAAGTEIAVPSAAVVAGRRISLDPSQFAGIDFLKVRSGTGAAPVVQGADRVLTLVSVDSAQALGVSFGAGGSGGSAGEKQSPWNGDINGNGKNLTNVNQVIANTFMALTGTDIMAGQPTALTFYNGAFSPRWLLTKVNAESTGNAGSDLRFANYSDTGVSLGIPVTLQRSSGNVGLGVANPTHQLELSTDSASKPATSAWTVFSDVRVKENVKDLVGGLEIIQQLRPIEATYNGLAGTPEGLRVVSFLADEIAQVLPGTVSSHSAKLREADAEETEILDVNIHEVLMHLVLAVQQLAAAQEAPV